MSGETLRNVRKQRGWTQAQAGERLGVSQAYVALLEKGYRRVPADLARRAVREFKLSPVLLPLNQHSALSSQHSAKPPTAAAGQSQVNEMLARDLSRLGYRGFAYLRGGWLKNPGEVLLTALAQPNLDSRVAEALPWLLLHYWDVDSDWLVTEARLLNLTNRLGFVVDLARRVLERNGTADPPRKDGARDDKNDVHSSRYHALTRLSEALRAGRLAVEDTFGQASLTETERKWFRANRPPEAQFWNLLTNWQPEFLQYAL